ncbi:hypothetical protein BN863_710 [Formosa agariphila KMM 3901]|uniref:Uncharacterized protein n=1 Tax=Formosa agariphila (strain DSM 15362 / KCTC 12365 / LMG 23005 / KMM 3901 / M-2Alg 35-1) TaxID=1347342 RepID=T2KHB0_FORAG|nr:hypothetical protein BN863_710 [Formosa agariphila KMM 3901]
MLTILSQKGFLNYWLNLLLYVLILHVLTGLINTISNLKLGIFEKKFEIRRVKTATLFLAVFLLVKPLIPLVEYAAFYDYIKNELCENKEVVEMQCNGKCHLAKEVAKMSDSPENGSDKKQVSIETMVVFYQKISEHVVTPIVFYSNKEQISSEYNLNYSYLNLDAVFHPPRV